MVATLQRTQPIPGRRLRPLVPTLQPSVCFWKARGHKGAWAPPGTKGLTRGPGRAFPRPAFPRPAPDRPSDRKGVGSRPQRHPALLCQEWGVLEAGRLLGGREPAGHADTISHTSLGRGACAGLPLEMAVLPSPPQGDSSQSSCHRPSSTGASLMDRPSAMGGLLYGGPPLLGWGCLPLLVGPPLQGPPSMGAVLSLWEASLYGGPPLLGWRCLPLWGASLCRVGLSLLGPSSTKMTADPRHE